MIQSTTKQILRLFLISMLPVIELRGGIPYATGMGIPWYEAYVICVIGNMIPVPIIMLFLKKFFHMLKSISFLKKPICRYEERLIEKSHQVEKYSVWGLLLLVAIPLPGTGAWTGSAVASLLKMEMKKAIPIIFLGVLISGFIITLVSYGVIHLFN